MKRINNRGLSLIELVVSMAIMLIVGVSLISFISVSTKQYKATSSEVNLQNEAQLADNQIHDLLIDVTAGLSYYVGDTSNVELAVTDPDWEGEVVAAQAEEESEEASKVKKLCFFDWDNSGSEEKNVVSVITWNEKDEELKYTTFSYNEGMNVTQTEDDVLLAEYVKDFKVDLSQMEEKNQVSYTIDFEKNKRKYSASNTVTLRNNVKVNEKDNDKIFDEISEKISSVSGVTITPESAILVREGTGQFTANVYGENNPSNRIIWSLSENSDEKTSIDQEGKITMGPKESSQNIKVTATSAQSQEQGDNPAKAASATVSTKYIDHATLKEGSQTGNTKEASLQIEGRNLVGATFESEPKIDLSYYTVDNHGNETAITNSNVQGSLNSLTEGKAGELYEYSKITVTASGFKNDTKILVKVHVHDLGNFDWTDSFEFTAHKDSDVNNKRPVKAIKIRESSQAASDNSGTYKPDRGTDITFKVYVQRTADSNYYEASVDGGVDIKWDLINGTSYITTTENADGTITLHVSKDPFALDYDTKGRFQLKATAVDRTGNNAGKTYDDSTDLEVPKVEIKSMSVTDSPVGPGMTTIMNATVSGIQFAQGDESYVSLSEDIDDDETGMLTIGATTFPDGNTISIPVTVNSDVTEAATNKKIELTLGGEESDNCRFDIKLPNVYHCSTSERYPQNYTTPFYYVKYQTLAGVNLASVWTRFDTIKDSNGNVIVEYYYYFDYSLSDWGRKYKIKIIETGKEYSYHVDGNDYGRYTGWYYR